LFCVVLGNVFQLAGPQFLRRGIDALARSEPLARVAWMAGALVVTAILTGMARFGMRQLLNGVSRKVEYDLRGDLYRHLETLQPSFYHRTPTGDLMALSTNDIAAVRMVAGPALMYLTETLTRVAMALPLMGQISWRLTAIGMIPLVGIPAGLVLLGRRIEQRFEEVQKHFADLTIFAHENLSGVRVVRAYRQEEAHQRRFAELSTEYLRKNMGLARVYGALFPAITLIGGLGSAATLWFGALLVIRGGVTLGDYVAFSTYLALLIWPMVALGWVVNLAQRGAASLGRIMRILEDRPTIADPVHPRPLPPKAGARTIEFRDVWFRYPAPKADGGPQRGWALEAISFTAPAGAWIAVVGATGAGKTTLVELIPRLADPDRGAVLLDGVPLPDLRLADLRRAIGLVPQETFLFSRTIGENIGQGELAQDAIEAAARVAQLHETVAGFPAGYDTMLGERGINLSGGQKQRAAIARALARDPDVVVLDDALSSVDTQTEAAILHGLKGSLAGRTAIVVSHRITAVRDADLILVLDEGRIVEHGRHEELFERRGRYWELLRRQQLEERLEAVG
jgi:ATP-binding cassette subfamily B protein